MLLCRVKESSSLKEVLKEGLAADADDSQREHILGSLRTPSV